MNFIRSIYLTFIVFLASLFGEGAQISLISFLIPSILMGVGIAIDVFISTTSKFQDRHLSWKNWTLPITLTHILFPAFGYFLFWVLSDYSPFINTLLSLIGFILVFLFIYEIISVSAGKKPVFGISEWIGNIFGFKEDDARLFIAILAVSWDALLSGPAKSAQALTNSWNTFEVLLSIAIAGLVVAIMAEVALFATRIMRKIEFKNPRSLTKFNVFGQYIELSVIGGFGVMSLSYAFFEKVDLYSSIIISALVLALVFLLMFRPLWKNHMIEASIAVSDRS